MIPKLSESRDMREPDTNIDVYTHLYSGTTFERELCSSVLKGPASVQASSSHSFKISLDRTDPGRYNE